MAKVIAEDIGGYYQHYPRIAAIVTAQSKGKRNAMAVAWHMPITFNPPLYGVAISPKRFTYQLIAESKEFHLLIARIGGNQWLTNALETVLDHLHRVLYLGVNDPDTAFDLRHEHDEIVKHLRARNPEEAKAAVISHVEHVRREYLASNKAITTILGQIMNR